MKFINKLNNLNKAKVGKILQNFVLIYELYNFAPLNP